MATQQSRSLLFTVAMPTEAASASQLSHAPAASLTKANATLKHKIYHCTGPEHAAVRQGLGQLASFATPTPGHALHCEIEHHSLALSRELCGSFGELGCMLRNADAEASCLVSGCASISSQLRKAHQSTDELLRQSSALRAEIGRVEARTAVVSSFTPAPPARPPAQ